MEGPDGKIMVCSPAIRPNEKGRGTLAETFILPVDWSGEFVFEKLIDSDGAKVENSKKSGRIAGKDGYFPNIILRSLKTSHLRQLTTAGLVWEALMKSSSQ